MPHLLHTYESLLWGSISMEGIVVASSGAFPWFDEVFAGLIALCLQALAKEARASEPERFILD